MSTPPASRFKMRFGTVADCACSIESFVGAMNLHLLGLENRLEGKLTDWDGSAREAYWTEKSTWNNAATNIENLLTGVSGAVRESCEVTQMTEQACVNMYN